VTNPVTAVLLNFRGYDTLLEVGVLLLAVLGVWSLPGTPAPHSLRDATVAGPVLGVFVRLLIPVMTVVGGYFLWAGAHAPGGAFQGGAVLAAAGVLLFLSGFHLSVRTYGWPLRTVLILGFAVFLVIAGGAITVGGRLLEYPRNWAAELILLVETALTLSIACILASLFVSGLPSRSLDSITSHAQE
jgi:multisubunit Na+/H+ antiporter MnhB subunit